MTFSTWLQPFQEPTMFEFRLCLFVQVTETFIYQMITVTS